MPSDPSTRTATAPPPGMAYFVFRVLAVGTFRARSDSWITDLDESYYSDFKRLTESCHKRGPFLSGLLILVGNHWNSGD